MENVTSKRSVTMYDALSETLHVLAQAQKLERLVDSLISDFNGYTGSERQANEAPQTSPSAPLLQIIENSAVARADIGRIAEKVESLKQELFPASEPAEPYPTQGKQVGMSGMVGFPAGVRNL